MIWCTPPTESRLTTPFSFSEKLWARAMAVDRLEELDTVPAKVTPCPVERTWMDFSSGKTLCSSSLSWVTSGCTSRSYTARISSFRPHRVRLVRPGAVPVR